jgi:hypothetical protein
MNDRRKKFGSACSRVSFDTNEKLNWLFYIYFFFLLEEKKDFIDTCKEREKCFAP